MKKILYLICFVVITGGCGSDRRPSWLIFGNDQLDTYKKYCLTYSKNAGTELHFQKAVDEIKKSGNLDLIQKAWLTRMAMHVALLKEPDYGEYNILAGVDPFPANRNYFLFLTGNIYKVDGSLLPSRYRGFLNALKKDDIAQIEKAITSMKNQPVSLLISAGISAGRDRESEVIINAAIDVSSQNGWKAALLAWMKRKADYYESTGRTLEASNVRRHIELIE